VPESARRAAERKARARAAGRRRQAVEELRLAEAVSGYAAGQVANGLAPEEARRAVVEAAAELELIAIGLRRLARLGVEERRALARMLHDCGLTQQRVAVLVGVSERTARYYVAGRRGTWASGG
jgi:hypothetical protein